MGRTSRPAYARSGHGNETASGRTGLHRASVAAGSEIYLHRVTGVHDPRSIRGVVGFEVGQLPLRRSHRARPRLLRPFSHASYSGPRFPQWSGPKSPAYSNLGAAPATAADSASPAHGSSTRSWSSLPRSLAVGSFSVGGKSCLGLVARRFRYTWTPGALTRESGSHEAGTLQVATRACSPFVASSSQLRLDAPPCGRLNGGGLIECQRELIAGEGKRGLQWPRLG